MQNHAVSEAWPDCVCGGVFVVGFLSVYFFADGLQRELPPNPDGKAMQWLICPVDQLIGLYF